MAEQLPSPPTTLSSGASRRARRMDASSSSEGSLGSFGISNQLNRCIAPPRPLPLETIELTSKDLRQFLNTFLPKAWELMEKAKLGIEQSSVEVDAVQRMFRGDPEDVQPTILIVIDAPWSDELKKSVEVVVEGLKSFVDAYVSNHSLNLDIAVELISKTLVDDKFVSVIDCNEPGAELLARAWPGIRHNVFSTLEEYASTKGCTTAISLLRLGYDRVDTSQNPRTVYITLDYNSSGYGWPPVSRRIQEYLDSFNMALVVHMEHNFIDDMSEFPLLKSSFSDLERNVFQKHGVDSGVAYSKGVKLGDAIGAAIYLERSDGKMCNPQIGTLGCWVEIKLEGKDHWIKMGLSCYHVLRCCLPGFQVGTKEVKSGGADVVRGVSSHPKPNTSCWEADKKGFVPSKTSEFENVEHPPRMRHNLVITDIEAAITRVKDCNGPQSAIARLENELRDKKMFFDEGMQEFGSPYLASGYLRRSATGGRLDWSLIKPNDDNRVAGNPLPPTSILHGRGYNRSEMPWEEDTSLKSQGKSIRDHVKDGTFDSSKELLGYKRGATTGFTVGKLSVLKTDCTIIEEKHLGLGTRESPARPSRYSTEYIFCGAEAAPIRSFAEQGDSGAAVYDQEGRILGIVFRGQMPQQSRQGYAMVTPIEDVFEDIKKLSEGKVEDIRVLGST